jgi:hypothetical protein
VIVRIQGDHLATDGITHEEHAIRSERQGAGGFELRITGCEICQNASGFAGSRYGNCKSGGETQPYRDTNER